MGSVGRSTSTSNDSKTLGLKCSVREESSRSRRNTSETVSMFKCAFFAEICKGAKKARSSSVLAAAMLNLSNESMTLKVDVESRSKL